MRQQALPGSVVEVKLKMPVAVALLDVVADDIRQELAREPALYLTANLLLIPLGFRLIQSMENRRRYCITLLMLVVKLCSCSPAKEAEYFTTQRYSLPCTRSFSAAARTPGC